MKPNRGKRGSPGSARAKLSRAMQMHQAGDIGTAQKLYLEVLREDAGNFGVLYALGVCCCQQERYEPGVTFLRQALALRPDVAVAHCVLSDALNALSRYDEARIHGERAVALDPASAESLSNLGKALHSLARHPEAIARYEQAIALKPNYADAHENLGSTLCALGRYDEAVACLGLALALKPNSAEANRNLGNALHALGRHEDATARYEQALALQPANPEEHYNLGLTLHALGRFEEAIEHHEQAVALWPAFAEARCSLGDALRALNRPGEALTHYAQALAIKPDLVQAQYNMSHALLALGRYAEGWQPYEMRPRAKVVVGPSDFGRPLWLGNEDIAGKTILLYAEQGLGDTIQFCRYATLVAQQGANVILAVQRPLKTLLADPPGPLQVVASGDALAAFDYQCPLPSLPLALSTRLDTIPAPVPYLAARPDRIEKWIAVLGPKDGPRIGIAWSGSPGYKADRNRSIPVRRLLPLLTAAVSVVSLHHEVRAEDQEVLDAHPEILRFGEELRDFTDMAALMTLLDLVISVDTSVAHLAGALGRPVWVLLPFAPHWVWMLNRTDSPWYPTARLFRQPRLGEWDSVIRIVGEHLAAFGA